MPKAAPAKAAPDTSEVNPVLKKGVDKKRKLSKEDRAQLSRQAAALSK